MPIAAPLAPRLLRAVAQLRRESLDALAIDASLREACLDTALRRLLFLCALKAGGWLGVDDFSSARRQACAESLSFLGAGLFTESDLGGVPDSVLERWLALVFSLPDAAERLPELIDAQCEHAPGRRQSGTYYTAPDVARYLCEATVLPHVLAGATEVDRLLTENGDLRGFALARIGESGASELRRIWERARSTAVLDPTCGSGAFLRSALGLFQALYLACAQRAAAVGDGSLADIAAHAIPFAAARLALERNLHGVDLSAGAVETARMLLALEALRLLRPEEAPSEAPLLPPLDRTLRAGNALVGWEREDGGTDPDRTLWQAYRDEGLLAPNVTLEAFRETHRPLHWLREFPEVMARGGFDVVIGNPPYVSLAAVRKQYRLRELRTASCESLYAPVVERALRLRQPEGRLGMIVPISAVSGEGYAPLAQLLLRDDCWISTYSNRPAKLFPGVEQRLALVIGAGVRDREPRLRVSPYQHWRQDERPRLFARLCYCDGSVWPETGMPAKTGTAAAESIFRKVLRHSDRLGAWEAEGEAGVWYHDGPTYWVRALPFPAPGAGASSHYHRIPVGSTEEAHALAAVLSSSSFYFFYKAVSNCRDLGRKEWAEFPIDPLSPERHARLAQLGGELAERLQATCRTRARIYPSGQCEYAEYYPARAKDVLDEIDRVLAAHYGFTDAELEFLLQYEVRYRTGG